MDEGLEEGWRAGGGCGWRAGGRKLKEGWMEGKGWMEGASIGWRAGVIGVLVGWGWWMEA